MSSPCRTTSLLVSKESNGRIAYNSREKEDSLSLKMGEQTSCISFSFLPLYVSFPFCFSFLVFSFLISHLFHFLFIFSSPSVIFSPFLEQPLIPSKGGNFLPFSSNHLCGHQISLFIPYFLFMTSSTTWLNVSQWRIQGGRGGAAAPPDPWKKNSSFIKVPNTNISLYPQTLLF